MEGKDNMHMCGCGASCKCGCGMGHGHHGYWIAKKVFLLLLLVVVFCFGVQLGQLKTLSGMYGHGAMMRTYNTNMMYGTSTRGW